MSSLVHGLNSSPLIPIVIIININNFDNIFVFIFIKKNQKLKYFLKFYIKIQ